MKNVKKWINHALQYKLSGRSVDDPNQEYQLNHESLMDSAKADVID